MPPAPTFPWSSALPEGAASFRWADRDRRMRFGLFLSLSGFPPSASLLRRVPSPVPAEALRPRSVPVGLPSGFRPAFTLFRSSVRNIAVPFRNSGFRSPDGTAVPFGSRFASPSPEGSGSAGRSLESGFGTCPRAVASRFFLYRPASSSAASALANLVLVRLGNVLELSSFEAFASHVGRSRPHAQSDTLPESRKAESTCG